MIKIHRYSKRKWKEQAVLALYLLFLLAQVSEFFYAYKVQSEKEKRVEVENRIQIPPHLPEEGKLEFTRIPKIRYHSWVAV